jgi:hypothetical protein
VLLMIVHVKLPLVIAFFFCRVIRASWGFDGLCVSGIYILQVQGFLMEAGLRRKEVAFPLVKSSI